MKQPSLRPDALAEFVTISALLTGFRVIDLEATGQTRHHFELVRERAGHRALNRLCACAAQLPDQPASQEDWVRANILPDSCLGPLARNLMKLWYLGIWYGMPGPWRHAAGGAAVDESRVASAEAYEEGLVWAAIGAHPPGAKPTGFASWTLAPPPLPESEQPA
jgi:hypothetical protein